MRKYLENAVNFAEVHAYRIVIGICILLMIAGVAYSIILGDKLRFPDEEDYYTIAVNLAQKGSFSMDDGAHPTAFRPPGYPFLMMIFVLFGAQVAFMRVLNFIMLSGTIYLAYLLGIELKSKLTGILAACAVTLYPALFYTAGTLYSQTEAMFLFLLLLLLLFKWYRRSLVYFAILGAIFGYLILTVPGYIFILGVVALWLLITIRPLPIRSVLVLVIMAGVVVGAWSVRNYLVFGHFIFVSSNSGLNLLLGNSPNATASTGVNADITVYEAGAQGLNEIDRDRYFQAEAIKWIRNNPFDALRLFVLKTLNYFNFRNELDTQSESSSANDLIMAVTYLPLLLLFCIRMALVKKLPVSRFELLIIVVYLSNAMFQAIFFTRIRFRLPFDPLMILSVAILTEYWVIRFIAKNRDQQSIPAD